jgi:hypothetical protein
MFIEKAIASGADKKIINNLARKTPLLSSMPSTPTNNGRENLHERVVSVDAIPQAELDAPLTDFSSDSEVGREGLIHWAGKKEIGVGKLNELKTTAPKYFAKKAAPSFGKTAQNIESTIMYQNIQATAIRNNKAGQPFEGTRVHNLGGTTAAKQFSIQFVTWDTDTTTGLYSPTAFGDNGAGFGVAQIGKGTYLSSGHVDPKKNGIEVYGASYRMDFGVQLADAQNVTSIVNIENTASIVDDIQTANLDYWISMMLSRAGATAGMTAIYMHSELLVAIEAAFVDKLNTTSFKMGGFDNELTTWRKMPIITTDNMYNGTEPVITL